MREQGLVETAVTTFESWLKEGLSLENLQELLQSSEEGKLGLEELGLRS